MKRLCPLTVLALAACGSAVGTSGESTAPLMSIQLASQEEQPGFEPVEFAGRALFMAPEPIVSDDDVAAAVAARGEDAVVLDMRLTPGGAEQLRKVTLDNIGRPLVLRFDSDIVGVPIIRSEISGSRVQLSVPATSDLEVDEIVERVRARWPVE